MTSTPRSLKQVFGNSPRTLTAMLSEGQIRPGGGMLCTGSIRIDLTYGSPAGIESIDAAAEASAGDATQQAVTRNRRNDMTTPTRSSFALAGAAGAPAEALRRTGWGPAPAAPDVSRMLCGCPPDENTLGPRGAREVSRGQKPGSAASLGPGRWPLHARRAWAPFALCGLDGLGRLHRARGPLGRGGSGLRRRKRREVQAGPELAPEQEQA